MKIFPLAEKERLIKTSLLFFLIGFLAALLKNELKFQDVFAVILQQDINLFLPSIATLLAAYLGANYAFKLQVASCSTKKV
ncbi:MAG: hypothetical protein D3910_10065 [Candidatus Electrothrix sp. ATG2]|nr:hypothetical protein [Candidatus Electrothrix sp. ATG2]